MSVTTHRAGPPDGDATVIEQSWDDPERFAAIFDRYFTEIHRYLARRVGGKVASWAALGVGISCAAAALVIAALVTNIIPAGPAHTGPGPAHTGPAGAVAGRPARAFLLAMATKAGHSPGSNPAAGRYWCSQTVSGTRELVGPGNTLLPPPWVDSARHASATAPPGYRYAIFSRSLAEDCLANPRPGWAGGSIGGFYQSLGTQPASPADAAAWRRAGSPDHWKAWYAPKVVSRQAGPRQPAGAKPGQAPWGSDASLPADPAKLRAIFLAHPLPYSPSPDPTNDQEVATAALRVMSGPVSPAVRAAAYQVLASVPGIQMKPGVRDPGGHVGTAVWMSQPGQPILEWTIVDPATGNLLSYEDVAQRPIAGAPAGTVLDYALFIGAHWTDTAPPKG